MELSDLSIRDGDPKLILQRHMKLYQGEGHLFRSAINIKDAWQSELAFYRTVWGIATDAPIHVEIANL